MTTTTETKAQGNGTKELTRGVAIKPQAGETNFPLLRSENPFVFMRRFAEDMERFFEDFGRFRVAPLFRRDLMPKVSEFGRAVWSPEVEVFERDGQLTVRSDLPGLTKDDVRLEITDHTLTLSGERKDEHEEKGEGFYRTERTYGSFYRSIPLPEGVKTENATATFKNGVLEVVIEAPERKQMGRQLEIKEEKEASAAAQV